MRLSDRCQQSGEKRNACKNESASLRTLTDTPGKYSACRASRNFDIRPKSCIASKIEWGILLFLIPYLLAIRVQKDQGGASKSIKVVPRQRDQRGARGDEKFTTKKKKKFIFFFS
jgi:hypothetical protein